MFQAFAHQTGNESKHDAADVLPAKYKQITQSFQKGEALTFTKMFQVVFVGPVENKTMQHLFHLHHA